MKFEFDSIEEVKERIMSKKEIPDSILWEKINSKLVEADNLRKKRRTLIISFSFVSFFSLIFIYFLVNSQNVKKFPKREVKNENDSQNEEIQSHVNLSDETSSQKKKLKSADLSSKIHLKQANSNVIHSRSLKTKVSKISLQIAGKSNEQKQKNTQISDSNVDTTNQFNISDRQKNTNGFEYVDEQISSGQSNLKIENSMTIQRMTLLTPSLSKKENANKLIENTAINGTRYSGKIYLGLNLNPLLSNRILTNTGNSAQQYNSLLENERGVFTTNYGISFGYRINNHFSIKTGLQNSNFSTVYSLNNANVMFDTVMNRYSFQTTYGQLELPEDDLTNQNPDDPDESEINAEDSSVVMLNYTNRNTVRFLQVPLVFEYGLNINRLRLFVSSGITLSRLTKAYSIIETQGLSSGKNDLIAKLNKWLYGGNLEIGCEYFVTNHFSLTASPSVNYSLNFINKNQDVRIKPYWIGVNASLRYYLK